MNELIARLTEAYGPSGFEDNLRAIIQAEVEPLADEIRVDALGNLIARRHTAVHDNGSPFKIMVAAHMDEIGLMVTHITEKGFLRFTGIGGIYTHTLLGGRVQFANGVIGVIGCDRIEDRSRIHPLQKYYIDVGATSREDCPVNVGDAAGFVRPFLAQEQRLAAKSMDDRIGCVVAIEALRQLRETAVEHDIYFVFSVQEEVGTRGAEAAANGLEPDIGLALDVTKTGDVPESEPMAVALGAGPAIKVKDSGMIAHVGLVRLLKQRAEEADIPYQLEVLEGGSTDARSIQIAGPGAAAGCISIPCRYVHTQSEMVDGRDVENAVRLLVAFLSKPITL
jgi:endoglucanase